MSLTIAKGALRIATVAVLAPLRQTFDYSYPVVEAGSELAPGCRVWVPFGRSFRIAVVMSSRDHSGNERADLKSVVEVLDDEALINPAMLELARWGASYYHHPIGDVIATLLPTALRRKQSLPTRSIAGWKLTAVGREAHARGSIAGARQSEVLRALARAEAATAGDFAGVKSGWRAVLKRLVDKGWVETVALDGQPASPVTPAPSAIALNSEQVAAAKLIAQHTEHYQAIVLHGVTGSGKTEVYLEAIAAALLMGRQALVLVPEIALTQQLVARFRARFGNHVGLLHSSLSDKDRALTWDSCRRGEIGILIGTRSAVWVGLPNLGLVIVDEEHDGSYKQQEGFRYSARDIAVVRAQQSGIPVVLGSATPSLETLTNIQRGKFITVRLESRARSASMPTIECVDVRGLRLEGGLGHLLIAAMREHLARGEQVMLFLNRRGYAPLLICRACGELRRCDRCDAYLVYHKQARAARCHHCDRQWSLARAANCCNDEEIVPVGSGTERLEEVVLEAFPDYRICRIDRDTVRRPGAFDAMLQDVAAHRVDILIGTQMVAKGLDFSDVTLVGIVDTDSRLYSVDFRAEERLAQLLIQVAGRAGRARKPGTVLVQTHHPDHPVLRRIIEDGYEAYASQALAERAEVGLPPFASMAIVRAESPVSTRPLEFLGEVRRLLLAERTGGPEVSYPIPALMERRAGSYRALIVIRSARRADIGRVLTAQLGAIEALARRVRLRWSLDIDPQDTL